MSKNRVFYALTFFILATAPYLHGQNSPHPDSVQTREFKPSGKLWGLVFGDYFLKVHADSLKRGNTQYSNIPKNYDAFAFRRIYLGYDFQFNEKFSAQFLLANESDNADASGERTLYIKAANIRWKDIVKNNDLIVGQAATPLFVPMSETIWSYRNVEKTIADMRYIGSSNDLGVMWQGKLNDQGNFGYNFMLANGTSQRPENDRYKKFYYELYTRLMNQKLILDLTGDYEAAGHEKSKTTVKGFAVYVTKPVTVGIEALTQAKKNAARNITDAANPVDVNVVQSGFTVFVRGCIIPDKLNYFARYDNYNPDTRFNPGLIYLKAPASDKENFIIAGIDWSPIKNVHFEPNLWYDSFRSMKNNVTGNARSDYDMTARITFYYVFR